MLARLLVCIISSGLCLDSSVNCLPSTYVLSLWQVNTMANSSHSIGIPGLSVCEAFAGKGNQLAFLN